MSDPAPEPSSGLPEEELLLALADDFAARLRAGERVTVEDYVAKHPALADRIRKVFSTIALIEETRSVDSTAAGERPGSIIGRYKLLERIGEGGFGVVYMAEQQQPVRRKVALKVIKPGVDTRQVIARFEAERQALALMDHENIARVLDAGATDSGRPYFVMELVHGVPITEYCDKNQLPPRERLELFAQVCRAVQHAHTKGIIHRDIKPTNVLVTLHEGVAVPKVIDFGVAKATGQQLTELTLFTNFAQMVGTPLYMSPEQAEMTSTDVDTRSDIYSLGVVLYELLTGTTPLDKDRLKQAALDEVRRLIREEDPPRPSTRLSGSLDTLASISAQRKTEPAKLTRLLRGELDWIVMKALEKDRNRRYETAIGFGMDVQRYLADEAVLACPPSRAYRLKKFVRRNKGPVLAAAVVLLTLMCGIVGTSTGLVWAERARRAEGARAEGERLAKQDAQKRLAQIEKGTEILASVFQDVDPKAEQRDGVTLRVLLGQRLDAAVRQLEGDAVADPLIVARLQHLLGVSLRELGHLEQAEQTLLRAMETREKLLTPNDLDTVATKHNLAQLYRARGKYADAEKLYREVLAVRLAKLGPEHDETLGTKNNLALVYMSQGKFGDAEPLLKEVLAVRLARLGADDLNTLQSKHNLAGVYQQDEATRDQAVTLLEEVLQGRSRKLRPGHPDLLQTKNNLSHLYLWAGQDDRAEALTREVMETSTAELGPGHHFTLLSKINLATVYSNGGKNEAAAGLFREVLDAQLANPSIGARHPYVFHTKRNLASVYGNMSRFDLSLPLHKEAIELGTAILGPDHPDVLRTQANLGIEYGDNGRLEEAVSLLEYVQSKGERVPNQAEAGWALIRAYARAGKASQATTLATTLVQTAREQSPPESPRLAATLNHVGKALLDVKLYTDAEILLREGLSLRVKQAPDTWDTHVTKSMLGGALLGLQKYADAEPLLVNGYAGLQQTVARAPRLTKGTRLSEALESLVQFYDAVGKPEEAAKWRKELDAVRATAPPMKRKLP